MLFQGLLTLGVLNRARAHFNNRTRARFKATVPSVSKPSDYRGKKTSYIFKYYFCCTSFASVHFNNNTYLIKSKIYVI